jgi:hypothetical protein
MFVSFGELTRWGAVLLTFLSIRDPNLCVMVPATGEPFCSDYCETMSGSSFYSARSRDSLFAYDYVDAYEFAHTNKRTPLLTATYSNV